MNSQQLEYVRQQLIVATADLSGATKGQLVAFAPAARRSGELRVLGEGYQLPFVAPLRSAVATMSC